MGYEEGKSIEKSSSGGKPAFSKTMTLQKAVDMGEYDPQYLSTFPEWNTFSKHVQLQFIQQGLDNRRKQLLQQWAAISNAIDFRLKPELHQTLQNIHKQLDGLEDDRERLYSEYLK